MAILKVLKYPDPFLKIKTNPINFNHSNTISSTANNLKQITQDMLETMYSDNGVCHAATQVGLDLRLFVMDCSETHTQPLVFINPEIIEKTGELDAIESEEGCLSFPGVYAKITRARKITIQALNLEGQVFTEIYTGLEARCVQHELDHLDGIVFLDYLPPVKRKLLEKKMQQHQKKVL